MNAADLNGFNNEEVLAQIGHMQAVEKRPSAAMR